MLKQRVLTALILGPLVVWGILGLSTPVFALALGGVIVGGSWEWGRFANIGAAGRVVYAAAVAAILFLLWRFLSAHRIDAFALSAGALLWWAAATVMVLRFPAGSGIWSGSSVAPALGGIAVLVPAWAALVAIHGGGGHALVLLLTLLVWVADIGAFFSGRRWGRHKLAPRVSPGKTWEGVGGALAAAAVLAVAAAPVIGVQGRSWAGYLLLCLATVMISVVGDLVESMFKRLSGTKDSGVIFPGHGGVLDRIDSVTAAAPLFAIGLNLLGYVR